MHILFLTDNFPPEVNAPASRTFEHCREWVNAGHQVTVITGTPNFPQGKVYEGYQNKLWQTENIGGIHVIRVWTYVSANEGFAKRILDYLSFMVSGFLGSLVVRKPELVIGTSPQFFTVCSAWAVGKCRRIPFVFELRDLWPESIKALGAMKDSAAIRFLEKIEMFLYRQAALIVPVTGSIKKVLTEREIAQDKIEVITNGVDISRFHPLGKDVELIDRYGLHGKFVAGYIGTHGMAHALETILDAAERLQHSGEDVFRFILLGHGASKQALVERAKKKKLKNVIFLNSVAKEEVPRYWSLLDASIIHLKRLDLFTGALPSKMFECMGMGIPILHGVAGESAEIIEREGVGLIFEPENSDHLCHKLRLLQTNHTLYEQIRSKALAAAGKYDRTVLAHRMLEKLLQLNKDQNSTRRE